MDKFTNMCNSILGQQINLRIFYEGIITRQNPYTKRVIFQASDFSQFYKNTIKIKDNVFQNILSDSNILIETIDQVNFHQPVLDLFLNAYFGQQIMPQHILQKLNKNWIYYNSYKEKSLKDRIPIYVFQFDFTNDDKIFQMFCHLYPKFKSGNKTQIVNEFKRNCGNCIAFVTKFNKAIIFCFNEPVSKVTIAHELCHYFQKIIHVLKTKDTEDTLNVSDSGISQLQLSKDDLQYLLNKDEFYPHIYIDMVNDFKKVYYLAFSHLSKQQFLDLLFSNIEQYKEKILCSDFAFIYSFYIEDRTSIKMLAALCYLNYRYIEVKKKLTEQLI